MAAGQVVVFPPIGGFLLYAAVSQLKQGLAVVDPDGLVKFNLPDDPTHPITIGWYEDLFPNFGALYEFVQTQLVYSPSQMSAFYATLVGYPVYP